MTAVELKRARQAAIVAVLRSHPVETQAQLAEELHRLRIEADQATISRDLRQLGVARVEGTGGRRYLPPPEDEEGRLAQILRTQLARVDLVAAMVVLHTSAGAAPVVASAVDAMRLDQVAGTVAGDDTVFIQARSAGAARQVVHRLEQVRQWAPGGGAEWARWLPGDSLGEEDGTHV
ncbi:MAG: arginine repressor [Candidatus Dormibacteria bacterium]